MGIFQPGLLIGFDCDAVEPTTVTGTGSATLATVTLNVESTFNTVWLTAYANWFISNAANDVVFSFVREDGEVICTARENPSSANNITNTAFTCCDPDPLPGETSYRLVVTGDGPNANAVITITTGSLTGALINT